jgi:hypothetical protein
LIKIASDSLFHLHPNPDARSSLEPTNDLYKNPFRDTYIACIGRVKKNTESARLLKSQPVQGLLAWKYPINPMTISGTRLHPNCRSMHRHQIFAG